MKRIKIRPDKEILILTGMIISTRILRLIRPQYKKEYMKSSLHRNIAKWTIDYFDQFDKAPSIHIQDIFEEQIDKGMDEDQIQMIGNVLDRLSKEFDRADKFNEDLVLKKTEEYFTRRKLEILKSQIGDNIDNRTNDEAVLLINEFNAAAIYGDDKIISPMDCDEDKIVDLMKETDKPLFRLPGAVGQFINEELCRERLIGIMGREKVGKTWNLLEFVLQATRQRCNTLFFQAGDMTENQQLKRIFTRISKKAPKKKDCGKGLFPVLDCLHNQFDDCDKRERTCDIGIVANQKEFEDIFQYENKKIKFFDEAEEDGYTPCTACRNMYGFQGSFWYQRTTIERLRVGHITEAQKKFEKRMKGKHFKLITYPTDSLTISLVKSHIDYFINAEGFMPDLIAVDYPEIMSTSDTQINEERHRENYKWKNLRAISQIYNCLVLAPTQADAESYGKKSLGLNNFTEDKRKYSHVTAMLSLNQLDWETVAGILRIGKLLVREGKMEPFKQATVLQHLATGQPWVSSYF